MTLKSKITVFILAVLFSIQPVFAQSITNNTQSMIDMPMVKLRSLDKITARTMTFKANVGSTIKFGSLYIKAQACRKSTPIEKPEAASFLQVWEIDNKDKALWIFSGWMFASSPGLSSMDHPIYDIWVLDCLEKNKALSQK